MLHVQRKTGGYSLRYGTAARLRPEVLVIQKLMAYWLDFAEILLIGPTRVRLPLKFRHVETFVGLVSTKDEYRSIF